MKNDNTILIGGDLQGVEVPQKTSIALPQKGALSVDGTKLYQYSGTAWDQAVDLLDTLFTFSTFTFTNLGVRGGYGSALAAYKTAYGAQPWINTYYNVTNGIQHFTVPKTGVYTIIVTGAAGTLGSPAKVSFTRALEKGDVLHMICGKAGASNTDGNGASAVYTDKLGLLCVAGAAAGYQGAGGTATQRNAKTDLAAAGGGAGAAGSTRTSGGQSINGGGGAGWLTNGQLPGGVLYYNPAYALNNANPTGGQGSGAGSGVSFSAGQGGFGGGGGGVLAAALGAVLGGGGGYTGGSATGVINQTASASGTGGTSYLGGGSTLIASVLETTAGNFGNITVTLNPA